MRCRILVVSTFSRWFLNPYSRELDVRKHARRMIRGMCGGKNIDTVFSPRRLVAVVLGLKV